MKVTPARFLLALLLYSVLFILLWVCYKVFVQGKPFSLPTFF